MSQKPKVIVSVTLPPDLRERLAASCDIIDVPVGQRPEEALSAETRAQVTGMVCTMKTKIDTALLEALPALTVSSNFAVGFDNVDVAAASSRKVLICNTPRVLDGAVADVTIGLMLCLAVAVITFAILVPLDYAWFRLLGWIPASP